MPNRWLWRAEWNEILLKKHLTEHLWVVFAEEVNGFRDAKIMIFCGVGSVPYVQQLEETYENVEVNVQEGGTRC